MDKNNSAGRAAEVAAAAAETAAASATNGRDKRALEIAPPPPPSLPKLNRLARALRTSLCRLDGRATEGKLSTHPIRLLHVLYVQHPLALLLVGNQEDPIICYDYVGVDAENCLALLLQPGDLFSGGRVKRAKLSVSPSVCVCACAFCLRRLIGRSSL